MLAMFNPSRERPFWPMAVLVFALLAAGNYFHVFVGSIPFPAHIVQPFPAWGGSAWIRWVSEPREIFPAAPLFEFLNRNADPGQFRVVQVGTPYSANAGMMYGFASADGYDIALERTKLFTADFSQERDDGVFPVAEKILQIEDRRLDMLNIKYFVVDKTTPEFQQ